MWKCNENLCLVCGCQKVNKICDLSKGARKKCNQTRSRRVTLLETSLSRGSSPALTAPCCTTTVVTSPNSWQQEFGQQISPKRRLSWLQSSNGWEKSLCSSLDASVCTSAVRSAVLLHRGDYPHLRLVFLTSVLHQINSGWQASALYPVNTKITATV